MTRKDFELIASTIASLNVSEDVRQIVAESFRKAVRTTNDSFKDYTFTKACGVVATLKVGKAHNWQ